MRGLRPGQQCRLWVVFFFWSGGTGFVCREAFKDKPAGVRGVGYFKRFVQEVERVFYSTKIFLELDRAIPEHFAGGVQQIDISQGN